MDMDAGTQTPPHDEEGDKDDSNNNKKLRAPYTVARARVQGDMAMFFDFPVSAPGAYVPVTTAWHDQVPLLAVAATETRNGNTNGCVHLFTADGAHIEGATLQRAAAPSSVAWHPRERILAVGFANGELLLWHEDTGATAQLEAGHDASITCLAWSTDGSYLISGDEAGSLAWCHHRSSDGGSGAQVAGTYRADGRVCGLVWRTGASAGAAQYFAATSRGAVLVGDAAAAASSAAPHEAFRVESGVHELLWDASAGAIVAIGTDMVLHQPSVDRKGELQGAEERVKLSGRGTGQTCWAGPGLLAMCTEEPCIRLWNVSEGDSYTLALADAGAGAFSRSDTLTSVAYHAPTGTLAAGSRAGMVFLWKDKKKEAGGPSSSENEEGADAWAFAQPAELGGSALVRVAFGGGSHGLLAAQNATNCVSVLREHSMLTAFGGGMAAIQVSSARIVIERSGSGNSPIEVDSEVSVKGLCVSANALALWGGAGSIVAYELVREGSVARQAGMFRCEGVSVCALGKDTLYTGEGSEVVVRNFQGASQQTLSLGASEGSITHLHCTGGFLVAATSSCVVRVWDVSRREARLVGTPRSFSDDVDAITEVAVNSNGTHASFLAASSDGSIDPSLWVWGVGGSGAVYRHGHYGGNLPAHHCWDMSDPRLVVTESASSSVDKGSASNESASTAVTTRTLTSLFLTPDVGLAKHSTTLAGPEDGALLGVAAPFVYAARTGRDKKGSVVTRYPLRDFSGLEDADRATRSAVLDFCYHSTVGDMDAAFKAMRSVKAQGVWENMARMCVTSRRMDVAMVCLGNMGNALATRALRREREEGAPIEAQVATLAVHLGMLPEAENLFRECGRLDKLNQLLQDSGRWKEALELARSSDRVALRNTYFAFARHLEAEGKLTEAVSHYELAGMEATEVPRLLFEDLDALEKYVNSRKSKTLYRWWARYLESVEQDIAGAHKYYAAAEDTLAMVRLHMVGGDEHTAKRLIDKTDSQSGAYYLAQRFEADDRVADAVKFYQRAGCYAHGIRLAKEAGMQAEVISLAMQASPAEQISAAEFCESNGMPEKAAQLYARGGLVSRALELCFTHNLYAALAELSEKLDADADPALLQRVADFFMDNNQQDKAVGLLIVSRRFDEALDMCAQYDVIITEEYAERMTVAKGEMPSAQRTALLERIGDICHEQGSFQIATRKYTQAGKLVKAMRALLRGGDTEKIIYFAGKCRLKEVYVMAANYLQSLDWRKDNGLLKHIVQFYTKGKALDQLSSFYEACASIEIDKYKNYEKALGALGEALRMLGKAKMKNIDEQERRVSSLQTRIELVQRFVDVKRLREESPPDMMVEARQLLDEPGLGEAVRLGDVFALMIDVAAAADNAAEAYELMQEMRERIPKVNIGYYVNMGIIEGVHRALGIPLGRGHGGEEEEVTSAAGGDGGISEDIGMDMV